jgi:hypothetical protein
VPVHEPSIADVLRTTLQHAQDLVRAEIALARSELRLELQRMRAAALLFAGAALSAAIAVIFLLTAAAWAIPAAFAWPAWTGFAIVGGAVLVAAVGLGLAGRAYAGGRPMPHTVATMKENLAWMRARTS